LLLNLFSNLPSSDIKSGILIIINLVLIESLLSVDNAAVLASLVMDLPAKERKRALRIGIVFAYIFRGGALISASLLIKIAWLKFVGGAYLLYLCGEFFFKLFTGKIETHGHKKPARLIPGLNRFWSTVILVELMDFAFSIDNVFAAVAFTHNIIFICTGVFIGIITMRIVAGYFVKLMERFPFLETVAFIVIGVLGLRLCSEVICIYVPDNFICDLMNEPKADYYFSLITAGIFFLPILSSLLFNVPERK
jgi:YkoY family integral membrane protein